MGISVKLRALGPGQRINNTFWILVLQGRWLQTNQTHIGPTLYVGPKYTQLYSHTAEYWGSPHMGTKLSIYGAFVDEILIQITPKLLLVIYFIILHYI